MNPCCTYFCTIYGIPFILIGIEHFKEPQKIVILCRNTCRFYSAYLTGIMEILVGLGIIYPDTREFTGRLTVFLIAIYPANFNMWINDVPFNELANDARPSG